MTRQKIIEQTLIDILTEQNTLSYQLQLYRTKHKSKDTQLDLENAALREQVRVLREAMTAMLTHMGMDEDGWNKPTYDKARFALEVTKGHDMYGLNDERFAL